MNGMGIILAGGRGSRLGGVDKARLMIGGRSCLERAQAHLAGGLAQIAVSVAANYPDAQCGGLPVIRDDPARDGKGRDGKGADKGMAVVILDCLRRAGEEGADFILTLPVDTPFLPADFAPSLIETFTAGGDEAPAMPVVSECAGRVHGLHALWPVAIADDLERLVVMEEYRKIGLLHETLGARRCRFQAAPWGDPFLNLNREVDLQRARELASSYGL